MQPARAVLNIEITQGVDEATPIAVVPFGNSGMATLPVDLAEIISADLQRSGRFSPLPRRDFLARPSEGRQVRFKDWRVLNAENLVIGKITRSGNGYTIQFQLFDVFRGVQLVGYNIPADGRVLPVSGLRRAAHQIADIIYEALTGERGVFATRIAYVTAVEGLSGALKYSLMVADADGYGSRAVLNSKQPLLSPSWSPNGKWLAYASFEKRRPKLFIQEIVSGRREMLTSFPGLNGAPSWSPNGRKLAMVLSKDGNPEIYLYDRSRKKLRRLTHHLGIDTEPVWAPDGRSIVFTSDRGGQPQLYRISVNGGDAQRLTFEGKYNAKASFSPDGKLLAMVHGANGKYYIALLELETGILRVLTDGALDESPSFAPNGSMIIYATRGRRSGVLAAVSVDGRVKQRLSLPEGDAREPAWSPFKR